MQNCASSVYIYANHVSSRMSMRRMCAEGGEVARKCPCFNVSSRAGTRAGAYTSMNVSLWSVETRLQQFCSGNFLLQRPKKGAPCGSTCNIKTHAVFTIILSPSTDPSLRALVVSCGSDPWAVQAIRTARQLRTLVRCASIPADKSATAPARHFAPGHPRSTV
jgi:hypothetical protein